MPKMTTAKTPITCVRVRESASGSCALARRRVGARAGARAGARLGQAHQQRRRHVVVLFKGDFDAPAHRGACAAPRVRSQARACAPSRPARKSSAPSRGRKADAESTLPLCSHAHRPAGARRTPRALSLSAHMRSPARPRIWPGSPRARAGHVRHAPYRVWFLVVSGTPRRSALLFSFPPCGEQARPRAATSVSTASTASTPMGEFVARTNSEPVQGLKAWDLGRPRRGPRACTSRRRRQR